MENALLAKKLEKFKEFIKHFTKKSLQSADDIHSLRIKCRELFSLLNKEGAFARSVKKVISLSNEIRDIDVFFDEYLESLPKKYRKKVQEEISKKAKESVRKKEIKKLAKERDAIILAHNYQIDDIQEIADITGDSLGLSIEAAKTSNKVIVFCGVHFMAETAHMLAPEKTVLLPRLDAGCPMADMITGEKLREFKAQHPGATTICYVNSSAEVKAESDLCCTSGNAVNVVKSVKTDKIIFVPDKNLGHYVQRFTDKEVILYPGFCPIHNRVTEKELVALKAKHPDAVVVAHPECLHSRYLQLLQGAPVKKIHHRHGTGRRFQAETGKS